MILAALMLLLQAAPANETANAEAREVFQDWKQKDAAPDPEKLGPGPHSLLIYNSKGIKQFEYRTGRQCQEARDSVRRQAARLSQPGVIYSSPAVTAICVPRQP